MIYYTMNLIKILGHFSIIMCHPTQSQLSLSLLLGGKADDWVMGRSASLAYSTEMATQSEPLPSSIFKT